ncbi:MAG: hypothetical protein ACOYYI_16655 [Chloroflexota bacterium]
MKDRYAQIQFIAANYLRLQGLRMVPIGLLVLFTGIWNNSRQGDLSGPILSFVGIAALYWLIDLYYNQVFGRVTPTPAQHKVELIVSITFSILAILSFVLDSAKILPISMLGVTLAGALAVDFWQATRSVRGEAFALFPEMLVSAIVIFIVSILPIFGITWWEAFGFKAQVEGMLAFDGIVLIVAGMWGHLRIRRNLSAGEAKSNDIAL